MLYVLFDILKHHLQKIMDVGWWLLLVEIALVWVVHFVMKPHEHFANDYFLLLVGYCKILIGGCKRLPHAQKTIELTLEACSVGFDIDALQICWQPLDQLDWVLG